MIVNCDVLGVEVAVPMSVALKTPTHVDERYDTTRREPVQRFVARVDIDIRTGTYSYVFLGQQRTHAVNTHNWHVKRLSLIARLADG